MPAGDDDLGIRCDGCGASDWSVLDVRHCKVGLIRRRRKCLDCGSRLITVEISDQVFKQLSGSVAQLRELESLVRQMQKVLAVNTSEGGNNDD